jgi:hypothetical protein
MSNFHDITPVRNGAFKKFHLNEVRVATQREKSIDETQRVYRRWGTGLVKCLHGRSYFVECKHCRRSRSEAEKNFEDFSAKYSK